jgi:hypothetical protein
MSVFGRELSTNTVLLRAKTENKKLRNPKYHVWKREVLISWFQLPVQLGSRVIECTCMAAKKVVSILIPKIHSALLR